MLFQCILYPYSEKCVGRRGKLMLPDADVLQLASAEISTEKIVFGLFDPTRVLRFSSFSFRIRTV
jgi:hypothetical protein